MSANTFENLTLFEPKNLVLSASGLMLPVIVAPSLVVSNFLLPLWFNSTCAAFTNAAPTTPVPPPDVSLISNVV